VSETQSSANKRNEWKESTNWKFKRVVLQTPDAIGMTELKVYASYNYKNPNFAIGIRNQYFGNE